LNETNTSIGLRILLGFFAFSFILDALITRHVKSSGDEIYVAYLFSDEGATVKEYDSIGLSFSDPGAVLGCLLMRENLESYVVITEFTTSFDIPNDFSITFHIIPESQYARRDNCAPIYNKYSYFLKFSGPTLAAASFVTLIGRPKHVGRRVVSYLSPGARFAGVATVATVGVSTVATTGFAGLLPNHGILRLPRKIIFSL
jgi:hypothetical protein